MPHLLDTIRRTAPVSSPPENTHGKTLVKNILVSSAGVFFFQSLGLLLSFGLQAFLSHTCGAAGLGGYTLFVSWLGILSVLTVPGLEGTLLYFLPRYEDAIDCRRRVMSICLFAVGAISIVVALLVLVCGDESFAWIGIPVRARAAFAFSILVFSFGKLLDAALLGMRDASATGYYNVIRITLRFLFCLPIIFYPGAAGSILFLAVAAESGLTLLLRIRRIRKHHPELLRAGMHLKDPPLLSRAMFLTTALSMFGISLVDSVFPFLDKATLGALLPLQLVGIYKVSESLASLSSIFVSPFISFWPYISKLCSENRIDELRDAYRSINLLIIVLTVPFTLALIETSGFVLSLFGTTFAIYGKTTYLILTLGCVADALAGPAGAVLKLTRHSRLSLGINTFLLVIYLGFSLVLVRGYGLVGVALAKAAVLLLGNVINVIANGMLLRVFPYTWKHAQLLGLGVLILTGSTLTWGTGIGTRTHFFIAFLEMILFASAASIIVRPQIRGALVMLRNGVYLPDSTRDDL